MSEQTRRFHAAHHGPTPLLLPNAWDFGSAAALADAGFGMIGTTSLGVAASYGIPDATGAARAETLAVAARLVRLPSLITVDIESGFSPDPAEVAVLTGELAELGVVGINIEDGRPDGSLMDLDHQAEVIATIKRAAPRLFVNARTDSYWLGLADPGRIAVERAQRFLAAGADGVFVPGAVDARDVRQLVASIAGPVNALFSPAHLSVAELTRLGVARISTGSLLYRAAIGAVTAVATAVRDGGEPPVDIPSYGDIQRFAAG